MSFMDNRVDVRAAVFYNQWTNIPINLTGDCGFIFTFNAGEAMTTGIELEGSAQLSTHWRLDFSVGYLKAELTTDAPEIRDYTTLGLTTGMQLGRWDLQLYIQNLTNSSGAT